MCTHEARVLIAEIVTTKVDADEKFTAFDVSREVQARQEEDGVYMERHLHLKNAIHDEMDQYIDSGLYEKTLHDVGAPNPAFLYHPDGTDAEDYVPQHRAAAPQPQPQPVPSVVQPQVSGQDGHRGDARGTLPNYVGQTVQQVSGQDGHRGDARGTLAVPCDMVRSVGFNKGDLIYVFEGIQNGEQVLCLKKEPENRRGPANAQQHIVATYTVDQYDNVRITHSTLSHITNNVVGIDTFDFEVDENTIIVSKN